MPPLVKLLSTVHYCLLIMLGIKRILLTLPKNSSLYPSAPEALAVWFCPVFLVLEPHWQHGTRGSERLFNDVTSEVAAAIRSQHIVKPVWHCLLGVHVGFQGSFLTQPGWGGCGWWHSFSSFEVEEETEVQWLCFCDVFLLCYWRCAARDGTALEVSWKGRFIFTGNKWWVSPSMDFKLLTSYRCINVFVCGAL